MIANFRIPFPTNASKANETIAALTATLTEGATALGLAEGATPSDFIAKLKAMAGELTQARADLGTAKASVASLVTELATVKASLETASADVAKMKASQADFDGKVSAAAATKAAEIAAAQGIPADKLPKIENQGGNSGADLAAQLNQITDPVARAKFRATHAAALLTFGLTQKTK